MVMRVMRVFHVHGRAPSKGMRASFSTKQSESHLPRVARIFVLWRVAGPQVVERRHGGMDYQDKSQVL